MNNTLGDKIANLLQKNGMTRRELAGRVGVTEVSMSRYISNERTPKSTVVAKIAIALHTTSDYLLGTEKVDPFYTEYCQIHRLIARNVSKMSIEQKKELVNALFESG